MYRIGIDLGGTKTAAAVVNKEKMVLTVKTVPTKLPRPAEELAKMIYDLTDDLLRESSLRFEDVDSVGIGIPGTVNRKTGIVEYANNFEFEQVPFVRMIEDQFPCPVYAENDAKAAALGEYLAGAGRGTESMVMITLGTGVGGGIIINGKLLEGYNGAAGEIGHMVVKRGGRPCSCGRKGCFEVYGSAAALVQSARAAASEHTDSQLFSLCGGELDNMNGKIVFQAVTKRDDTAKTVMDHYLEDLAEGIANVINILQPEMICIGGGLSGAGDLLLEPLKKRVQPLVYSRASEKNTRIVLAELGNYAGLVGASCLGQACILYEEEQR